MIARKNNNVVEPRNYRLRSDVYQVFDVLPIPIIGEAVALDRLDDEHDLGSCGRIVEAVADRIGYYALWSLPILAWYT